MDGAAIALTLGLAFGVTGADKTVSRELTENYPISGSAETARDISDWGKHSLKATMLISGLVYDPLSVPVQEMGARATHEVVKSWKTTSNRLRPDESDYRSFPSGHATGASYRAHATIKNLDGRHPHLATAVKAVAIGTAYFRVESGRHYPSDVLVGYALGKYMSDLVGVGTEIILSRDRRMLIKSWRF